MFPLRKIKTNRRLKMLHLLTMPFLRSSTNALIRYYTVVRATPIVRLNEAFYGEAGAPRSNGLASFSAHTQSIVKVRTYLESGRSELAAEVSHVCSL